MPSSSRQKSALSAALGRGASMTATAPRRKLRELGPCRLGNDERARRGNGVEQSANPVALQRGLGDDQGLRRAVSLAVCSDDVLAFEHAAPCLPAIARRSDQPGRLLEPWIIARADARHGLSKRVRRAGAIA